MFIFHHKNWFRLLESTKEDSFPGKDALYRFLNHAGYAWRRFLLSLGADIIKKVNDLSSKKRVTGICCVDDSMNDEWTSTITGSPPRDD